MGARRIRAVDSAGPLHLQSVRTVARARERTLLAHDGLEAQSAEFADEEQVETLNASLARARTEREVHRKPSMPEDQQSLVGKIAAVEQVCPGILATEEAHRQRMVVAVLSSEMDVQWVSRPRADMGVDLPHQVPLRVTVEIVSTAIVSQRRTPRHLLGAIEELVVPTSYQTKRLRSGCTEAAVRPGVVVEDSTQRFCCIDFASGNHHPPSPSSRRLDS